MGYAFKMKIKAYTLEVEVQMRHFYHSLSEKDRRRQAFKAEAGKKNIKYTPS